MSLQQLLYKGDVTRNNSQQRFLAQHSITVQHCCDIVSNAYNIVQTLQRCVAVKILVANRLLWHHLYGKSLNWIKSRNPFFRRSICCNILAELLEIKYSIAFFLNVPKITVEEISNKTFAYYYYYYYYFFGFRNTGRWNYPFIKGIFIRHFANRF